MLQADELLVVLGKGVGEIFPPALLGRILGEAEEQGAVGSGDLVVVEQPLDFPRRKPVLARSYLLILEGWSGTTRGAR